MAQGETRARRFQDKVSEPDPETGCTIWLGGRSKAGYGVFHPAKGETIGAHRWAMSQSAGRELTRDEFVCHTCDNPPCVRLDHLFIASHQQNMDDMLAKGRYNHGRSAKLDQQQVRAMREQAAHGTLIADLSRSFGVSEGRVSMIVRGLSWRDAGGPISPSRYKIKENR